MNASSQHSGAVRRFPFLGLVLLGLLALVPLRAQEADSHEPNDRAPQATPLTFGQAVQLSIMPVGDQDWYRFTVAQPGYVVATLDEGEAGAIDTIVTFLDARQNPMANQQCRVTPGDYYVQVHDQGADEGLPALMTLTLQFHAEIDASEPNHELAKARRVDLQAVANFQLMPVGDLDTFQLTITEAGYLHVPVDQSRAGHLDLRYAIRLADATVVPMNQARVTPGEVYVSITDHYEDESSLEPLQATFVFAPERDASEPNAAFGRARAATLNEDHAFQLMPMGDVDCFRLEIPGPGYLRVVTDSAKATHLDLRVEVYDAAFTRLGDREGRFAAAGAAYVKVYDHYNDESSLEDVAIRFQYAPETDPSEPNSDFTQARLVPLNEPVELHLLPVGDSDMLRIEAPQTGYLHVMLDGSKAGHLDLATKVYDRLYRELGAWAVRLEKGPAYIHIWDHYADESAFEPVTVTLRFFPETDAAEPDSRTRPRLAKLDEPLPVQLAAVGDADYFAVEVSSLGTIEVRVDVGEAKGLDPMVMIYDHEQRERGGPKALVPPGRAYVKIYDNYNDECSIHPMTATIRFTPEPADGRIGGLASRARPAVIGQPVRLPLSAEAPMPVASTSVPSAGLLTATVDWGDGQALPVTVSIYDGQRYLGQNQAAVQLGTVYVELAATRPEQIPAGATATLTLAHTPGKDASEPNDVYAQAVAVKPNQTADFTLFPNGDADVFSVEIPAAGCLWVEIDQSAAKDLDLTTSIYDADLNQVGGSTANVGPGRYTVYIYEEQHNESSTEPLKAIFHYFPETDASEPNDSFAQAREVQPNSTVDLRIMPIGDADTFRIRTDRPGFLQVQIAKPKADHLDMIAYIHGAQHQYLGNWGAYVAAGDVHVRLQEEQNNEFSPELIQASFVFTPEPDLTLEPNDHSPIATRLVSGTPRNFHLFPASDIDVFRLDVPSAGAVFVQLEQTAAYQAGIRARTSIYNAQLDLIGSESAQIDAPGPVFIHVLNENTRALVTEPLRLTALFMPRQPSAVAELSEPYTLEAATPGAMTCHSVRLPQTGFMAIEPILSPLVSDLRFQVYTAAGRLVNPQGPAVLEPGVYHIASYLAAGASVEPVPVFLAAQPSLDPYEPNDSVATATPITLPFAGWVCLHSQSYDWFSFTAEAGGLYQVRLDHPGWQPDAGLQLYQLDDGTATFIPDISYFAGADYTAIYGRLTPGRYSILAYRKSDAPGNNGVLRLHLRRLAADSEPLGDVRIMTLGLTPESNDYKIISALGDLIRHEVSEVESAEDVATALRETVGDADAPTDPERLGTTTAAASGKTRLGYILIGVLMLLVLGILVWRTRKPSDRAS